MVGRYLIVGLAVLALGGTQQAPRALKPQASFSEPYTWVRGVAELPDGRVFVADQREEAVYLADLTTRRKVGTNGSGPREYRAPVGVFAVRGDTAWIHDLQNYRLMAVTPSGVVAPVPVALEARTYIPRNIDGQGRLYWDNINSVRLKKREDPKAEKAALIRWNGTQLDTLIDIKVPGGVNPGPFPGYDVWAASADGRIVVVRNDDEYRVDWVDARGTRSNGARINEGRLRVTAGDKSLYAERLARRQIRGGGMASAGGQPGGPPQVAFPDQFPYAQRVLVSPSGQAWVERFRHLEDEEPLFDIFDGNGVRVGSVTLPAQRQVIGFGRRWLYAVRVDEDGLQWLERYDVR